MVELKEILLQVLLAVFQTGVGVIIIAPRLLHAVRGEHTTDHQSRAGCGVNVLTGASAFKKTEEGRIYEEKLP